MKQVIDFLFSLNGRVSRTDFILKFALGYLLVIIATNYLHEQLQTGWTFWLQTIAGLCLLWPSIALPVKRVHDVGRSGWWAIGAMLLMVSAIFYMSYRTVTDLGLDVISGDAPIDEQARSALLEQVDMLAAMGVMWLVIFAFMPILFFFEGTKGDNRFGPDPRLSTKSASH